MEPIKKLFHSNFFLEIKKRKKHLKPTAFTGGLALSFIYILSILFFDVYGEKLNLPVLGNAQTICKHTGQQYFLKNDQLTVSNK